MDYELLFTVVFLGFPICVFGLPAVFLVFFIVKITDYFYYKKNYEKKNNYDEIRRYNIKSSIVFGVLFLLTWFIHIYIFYNFLSLFNFSI